MYERSEGNQIHKSIQGYKVMIENLQKIIAKTQKDPKEDKHKTRQFKDKLSEQ